MYLEALWGGEAEHGAAEAGDYFLAVERRVTDISEVFPHFEQSHSPIYFCGTSNWNLMVSIFLLPQWAQSQLNFVFFIVPLV